MTDDRKPSLDGPVFPHRGAQQGAMLEHRRKLAGLGPGDLAAEVKGWTVDTVLAIEAERSPTTHELSVYLGALEIAQDRKAGRVPAPDQT